MKNSGMTSGPDGRLSRNRAKARS